MSRAAFGERHPEPSLGQGVERMRTFFQADVLRLAEPMDQQRHRGGQVAAFQQCFGDPTIGLRRIELLDVGPPEIQIAPARPGAMPGRKRLGDMPGRGEHLAA